MYTKLNFCNTARYLTSKSCLLGSLRVGWLGVALNFLLEERCVFHLCMPFDDCYLLALGCGM